MSVDEQVKQMQADLDVKIAALRNQQATAAAKALQDNCKHACVFCGADHYSDLEARVTALESWTKNPEVKGSK